MHPESNHTNRIIVRGANWIGDAVMTLPALERLRASFPRSHISLLATPLTAGLFESSPFVDEVIEYRRREDGARAFIEAVRLMRARRFDLAALFQNAFEAALLTALGGARRRIGFVAQGRGPLLTHKLRRGPRRNLHSSGVRQIQVQRLVGKVFDFCHSCLHTERGQRRDVTRDYPYDRTG